MNTISLIIKTPPISVNQLYQGRRFLTSKGKSIKERMAWEIKQQYKGKIITNPIKINIDFYFKDKRGMDIDGALKGLLDCMTGIVWEDDRLIIELHARKFIDKEKPSMVISIEEIGKLSS